MPEQFWRLTFREFDLKHAAFARAEDRQQGLMLSLAAKIGQYKKKDAQTLERHATALRRYPVKRWLSAKE